MIEDIIDFIFSNLFLVVIIAGGLISFFTENKKQKEASEERQQQRKTTSHPLPNRMDTHKPVQSSQQNTKQQTKAPSMKSIEEQREEQLKRLRRTVSTTEKNEQTDNELVSSDMEKRLFKKETKPKLQHQTHFQKRLTKTGLIDSIVMAEILDKPKSLRPHQRTRKY